MLTHFITQYKKKIILVNITTYLIKKAFKVQIKMEEKENPELTSSHRYTKLQLNIEQLSLRMTSRLAGQLCYN